MKSQIISLLKKAGVKISDTELEGLIEIPPSSELGDFAFPCFVLAKEFKKSPNMIAEELAKKISSNNFEKIEAKGPYLNFFVNKKNLVEEVVSKIIKEKNDYGGSIQGKGKTIVIDLSSPNIAKPFGIGHLRSTIIGNSISEISKKLGFKVVKINYLGDWGTQFGKIIVGWKKIGKERELKKDPIKYMLKLYIEGNKKEYGEEARAWFKKLEDGDKNTFALWKNFRELSLKEFNKLYKTMNIKFDVLSGESFYRNKMEKTVTELRSKNLLEESEGALIVNLEKYNLGVSLIKKSDGATLYATRDITAAIDRYNKYKFSRMIYEIGHEQELCFKQLFKVLELMGYDWAKDCVHMDHGMYLDSDGKRFATRKGKTVFMEDIISETIGLAKKIIEEKNPKLKNKDEVAKKVAMAAIFYGDLKNYRRNDLIFDIDRFVSFEGDTGPYIQYSYARASSILRKAKLRVSGKFKIKELSSSEIELSKKLAQFPEIVKNAYRNLNPALIANYSYSLAQIFNEFYHACPVIDADKDVKNFRLALVESFRIVLKNSLSLLGIETLEEM